MATGEQPLTRCELSVTENSQAVTAGWPFPPTSAGPSSTTFRGASTPCRTRPRGGIREGYGSRSAGAVLDSFEASFDREASLGHLARPRPTVVRQPRGPAPRQRATAQCFQPADPRHPTVVSWELFRAIGATRTGPGTTALRPGHRPSGGCRQPEAEDQHLHLPKLRRTG